jgi:hypothetical protein
MIKNMIKLHIKKLMKYQLVALLEDTSNKSTINSILMKMNNKCISMPVLAKIKDM